MTPRKFLAVAIMLSTNFDEWMMGLAAEAGARAPDDFGRTYWAEAVNDHAQRIGARRALWLEITG